MSLPPANHGKSTRAIQPLLMVVIAGICLGSIPPFAKIGLQAFGPFTLIAIRFLLATLVFVPLLMRNNPFNRASFKQLWLAGLVSAVNPILVFIGLQYTRASLSVLLYAAIPGMTAVYYAFTQHKKTSPRQVAGIIVGFAGVAIIALLPLIQHGQFAPQALWGNILTLAAVVAFFIYTVLSKRLQEQQQVPPVALTFALAVSSFLVSLPFAIHEIMRPGHSLNHVGPSYWLAAVEIGIIGTALGYFAYQQALKTGSELNASLFTYVQPVVTVFLAVVLLNEPITWPLIFGGIMALVGAQLALESGPGSLRRLFARDKPVPEL